MRKLSIEDLKIGTKFIFLNDTIVYEIVDMDLDDWYCQARWQYTSNGKKYAINYFCLYQELLCLAYIIEFE
jgi:hypothetical protein